MGSNGVHNSSSIHKMIPKKTIEELVKHRVGRFINPPNKELYVIDGEILVYYILREENKVYEKLTIK